MVGESWNILDQCINDIWPGWDNYDKEAYFTLKLKGQDVLMNTPGEPDGKFKLLDYKLDGKPVYMRKKTPFDKVWGGKRSFYVNKKRFRAAQFSPPGIEYCENIYDYAVKNLPVLNNDPNFKRLYFSPEYFIGVIVHEAFHLWQIKTNINKCVNAEHPSSFTVDSISYYQMRREGQILTAACRSNDKSEVQELAKQFLSVRNERRKLLTDEDIHWEQRNEWTEGSATYVQAKLMDFLAKGKYKPVVLNEMAFTGKTFDKYLNMLRTWKLVIHPLTMDDEAYALNRCYYYGMAQAYILDKLCGDEWKKSFFEDDVNFETLLEEYSKSGS